MREQVSEDEVAVKVRATGKTKILPLHGNGGVMALSRLEGAAGQQCLVIDRSEYGFSAEDEAKIAGIGIRLI